MNLIDEPNLPPAAVGNLTNISLDYIRDWRRQGFLDHYGEQGENGRWKYSARDVVGLWIADVLSQRGRVMGRRDALMKGQRLAGNVLSALIALRLGIDPPQHRFVAYVHKGTAPDGEVFGSSIKALSALALLEEEEFHHAEIFDIRRLTLDLPEDIQRLVIEADEGST